MSDSSVLIEPTSKRLPACRYLSDGTLTVDHRAILMLALPLVLNSAIQAILNLTDTWFVGKISVSATAALSVVVWPATAVLVLFGSIGVAVQTYAAQALGEGRRALAAHYGCLGLWASLVMMPCFICAGLLGHYLFLPFGFSKEILTQALAWWEPRIFGGVLGAAFAGLTGFFNATGHTRLTLCLTIVLALINIPCNYFFIYKLGWGISGSAWGTNAALLSVTLAGGILLFSKPYAHIFKTRRVWRPSLHLLKPLIMTSLGIGAAIAIDLTGYSLFQVMQAQLGAVEGAATQVVIALTALGYFPSIGLGIAGTTLVGQSIGAGSPEWAFRLGNIILRYIAGYMLLVTLLFLLFPQYMAEWFVPQSDPAALSMRALIVKLLFFAGLYQIPDGFHLGSSFCLRGAKDVKVTGRIVAIASFLVFVPLTHTLTFNDSQAWFAGLPQLGMGVIGGWMALTCYMFLLGGLLYIRWRSRSWMRI